MNEAPRGTVGRLAVRGPTGCRYLDDPRQAEYVKDGWNVTGDAFVQDEDGYFHFAARNDDMIVSAGYNIAGPEVEAALLSHDAVSECAVIGAPDEERGQIVQAFVVLAPGLKEDESLVRALQNHVKATIAPYKYPRAIRFGRRAAEDRNRQDPALRVTDLSVGLRRQGQAATCSSGCPSKAGAQRATLAHASAMWDA